MALAISVHPLATNLDMYGESDTNAAYSLSGHVSISLTSPYSLFETRRTAHLLLQSVSLTFEGQSEIFTPTTGYSSLRLCSITREIAPADPIELSNEGHEDLKEPCVWNVIFNIPIPGWLPPTTSLGVEDIGIRYALYATAKFVNLDEEQSPSWSFAALCSPFRARVKSVDAVKDINVRRFISAPRVEVAQPATLNFLVNSNASSSLNEKEKRRMPVDILNKIQVLTSVPEYVDVNDTSMPLTLRMRTKDMSEEDCKKLQVTDVSVDIVQDEKCRYSPSSTYLARFPLPPRAMQPPNLPLRDAHSISTVYDVGLFVSSAFSESICRSFSLLPSPQAGAYKLASPNYVFAKDAEPEAVPTWYTMDTTVPFVQRSPCKVDAECVEWAGEADVRPTMTSPLFSVGHEVVVALTCTYDLEEGEVARERLSFKVPVVFGRVAPRLAPPRNLTPPPPLALAHESGLATPRRSLSERIAATTQEANAMPNLPAYSQLYDRNGERKIDYSTPLPLYTPRSMSVVATGPLVDVSPPPPHADSSSTEGSAGMTASSNLSLSHGDGEKFTPLLMHGHEHASL
ncbi:hypothetical protein B0H34DRAFT_795232 [Crassisporium funariophilum]|nr:hypothetical protein B0H34DRAFT_795232 [Crassisporium funariophilum]